MINNINMIKVSSSNVYSVGYSYLDQNVLVEFLDGSQYVYHTVPEKEFLALVNAPSVGKYLDQNYKKGNCYKYSKVR